MELILLSGAILFALASAWFFVNDSQKIFNSPFFVCFITLISQIVMIEGSFITLNASGEALYWTRWVFYGLSCSLLAYTICKSLKFPQAQTLRVLYLTVIVMLTGALSSVYEGHLKILMFIISSLAYIAMIWPMLTSTQKVQVI